MAAEEVLTDVSNILIKAKRVFQVRQEANRPSPDDEVDANNIFDTIRSEDCVRVSEDLAITRDGLIICLGKDLSVQPAVPEVQPPDPPTEIVQPRNLFVGQMTDFHDQPAQLARLRPLTQHGRPTKTDWGDHKFLFPWTKDRRNAITATFDEESFLKVSNQVEKLKLQPEAALTRTQRRNNRRREKRKRETELQNIPPAAPAEGVREAVDPPMEPKRDRYQSSRGQRKRKTSPQKDSLAAPAQVTWEAADLLLMPRRDHYQLGNDDTPGRVAKRPRYEVASTVILGVKRMPFRLKEEDGGRDKAVKLEGRWGGQEERAWSEEGNYGMEGPGPE